MLVNDGNAMKGCTNRIVVRVVAVFVAATTCGGFGGQLVSAADKYSLIEKVYVFDARGTICLSCGDEEAPPEVLQVIESLDPWAVGRWMQSRFSFRTEKFNASFKSGDPIRWGLGMRMGEMGGVSFRGEGYTIHYESIPCWIWDCYKPRMWREDEHGALPWRWRRKVPFAHAPVYPFVVGDYLLFLASSSGSDDLIIMDVNTGRIVERFVPEGERYGFGDSAIMIPPAFYRDGYICLKGTTETKLDAPTKKVISETPAKTYVLKVNF